MSDEEFNRLLNGPLDHPLVPFKITRLTLALRVVVQATGPEGAAALRRHCRLRQAQDNPMDDAYPDDMAPGSLLVAKIVAEGSPSSTLKEAIRKAREKLQWEDS